MADFFSKIYVHWKVNPRRFDYDFPFTILGSPYRVFFTISLKCGIVYFWAFWNRAYDILNLLFFECFLIYVLPSVSVAKDTTLRAEVFFFLVWLSAFAKSFVWRVSSVQLVVTRMTAQMLKAMPERNLCSCRVKRYPNGLI